MTQPVQQIGGVQDGIPLFRSYEWHTYNWANYGPVHQGQSFSAVSFDQQTATSVRVNFTPALSGRARLRFDATGKYVGGSGGYSKDLQVTGGTPASITIQELQPATTYSYIIQEYYSFVDQTSQTVTQTIYSDEYEFSTAGGAQTAPVISQVQVSQSGGTGNRTAVITWVTDVPCNNKVYYGATVSYGSTSEDTTTPVNQAGAWVQTARLTAGNTYHYQCESQGRDYAHGVIATTVDATFVA
jgi:hypothetical protein